MRGLILSLGLLAGGALFAAQPAAAAVGAAGVSSPAVATASAIQPVYWVWHGRHWNHRRWAPRVRVQGVWVPGHYSYY